MKVIVIPNSFKNALTSIEAAESIKKGLQRTNPDLEIITLPFADGGDGTLDVFSYYLDTKSIDVNTINAYQDSIEANYLIDESKKLAIIELAEASGLRRLKNKDLNPFLADTYGTGLLINDALKRSCKEIILTVGGSATVDGGIGILKALGAKFYDSQDDEIIPVGPQTILDIHRINLDRARETFADVKLTILSDVTNKLLGKEGAVYVYGPQKGIPKDKLEKFEEIMAHWAKLLEKESGQNVDLDYSGASGGVIAGLRVLPNVEIVDGAEYNLRLNDFHKEIKDADLVITAEGQIDHSSGSGSWNRWLNIRYRKISQGEKP
jgi:glycerate kinase